MDWSWTSQLIECKGCRNIYICIYIYKISYVIYTHTDTHISVYIYTYNKLMTVNHWN